MERAPDRGGHSVYCSMVYIDQDGEPGSVHRKLMPTHEDQLVVDRTRQSTVDFED